MRPALRVGVVTAVGVVGLFTVGGLGYAMTLSGGFVERLVAPKTYIHLVLPKAKVTHAPSGASFSAADDQYGTTTTATTTTATTTTTTTTATTTTPTVAVPAAPTNVIAAAGSGNREVVVKWTASPPTGGTVTYTVVDGNGNTLGSTTGTSLVIQYELAQTGSSLTFTVTATNSAGSATSQPSTPYLLLNDSAFAGSPHTAVSTGSGTASTPQVKIPAASGGSTTSPVSVSATVVGGSVTVQAYNNNPIPGVVFQIQGTAATASTFFDIKVSTGAKQVSFQVCAVGLTTSSLVYEKGGKWLPIAASQYGPLIASANGTTCTTISVRKGDKSPSLSDLSGTVFAILKASKAETLLSGLRGKASAVPGTSMKLRYFKTSGKAVPSAASCVAIWNTRAPAKTISWLKSNGAAKVDVISAKYNCAFGIALKDGSLAYVVAPPTAKSGAWQGQHVTYAKAGTLAKLAKSFNARISSKGKLAL